MDVAPGRIVYTMFLNENGGIEADLTVTRLSETAYLAVVPGATLQRNLAWMRAHLGDDFAVITDVTAAESVLCLMGPQSRDVLAKVSPNDFSNAAHPFGQAREIEIGMGLARAHRVTYVGELGWELYVSADQTAHVFEAIMEAAPDLKLCGLHTLDSCRIEKAYRHWGHDITDEDHVLEAGLGFTVSRKKPAFLGREAVLRKEAEGLGRRMLQFRLTDPEPLLFHNEAIVRDGKIVGPVTSGNYGHHLGGAIGMGYVPARGQSDDDILGSTYQIEVAGRAMRPSPAWCRCTTRRAKGSGHEAGRAASGVPRPAPVGLFRHPQPLGSRQRADDGGLGRAGAGDQFRRACLYPGPPRPGRRQPRRGAGPCGRPDRRHAAAGLGRFRERLWRQPRRGGPDGAAGGRGRPVGHQRRGYADDRRQPALCL
jgi:heterotetrameric sarcosine oxidase gamma subunit